MAPESSDLSGHLKLNQLESAGLRAPAESGEVLFSFPSGELPAAVLHQQQRLVNEPGPQINGISLQELSKLGRTGLTSLAAEWTSRYRDLPSGSGSQLADSRPVVLSGHQPTLFHPGVWFKNFILSRLGEQLNAVAINLIIDNDVSGIPSVMIPSIGTNRALWQSVPYDSSSGRQPYEFQALQDRQTFTEFPDRLSAAVRPWVNNPLVHRLWPYVMESSRFFPERGFALAAGRHRLESELKLSTLEIPLSRVCQTEAFAHFVTEIFSRPAEFVLVHNRCLKQFRQRHGIRSLSHPLPPLVVENDSVELPFWTYTPKFPSRTRLIVRQTTTGMEFQGPDGGRVRLDSSNLSQQIHELANSPVCLRPRAILTTMFSRMVLSDLFVHGIGGAVYDQITDSIAAEFFGWTLPPFVTTTGTFRLIGWSPVAAASHLAFLGEQLRSLTCHPELAIEDSGETRSLIQAKQQLVSEMNQPVGRLERHFEMVRLNDQLREHLKDRSRMLKDEIDAKKSLREQNRIVASREVSFCAHPESLTVQLADSAASAF